MVEYIFDTARTVTDLLMAGVLERHPGLRVIVPLGGGAVPVLANRVNEFMKMFLPGRESGAADAIEQLRGLHYDMVGTVFQHQIPALLGLVDSDRRLFGSDCCWTPPPIATTRIAAIDAAETPVEGATWRTLTADNARRLFPRLIW